MLDLKQEFLARPGLGDGQASDVLSLEAVQATRP